MGNKINSTMKPAILMRFVACAGVLATVATPVLAADTDSPSKDSSWLAGWTLGYSPYTYHFSDAKKEHDFEPDDEKHKYVWLVNAEKQLDEHQVAGFALFSNSFGQPSQYGYYGWMFRPFESAHQFYFKLTGGVIHGYKFPYNKKIPLNNKHGWGVTLIPAMGWNFDEHWGAQVNLLGNSGLMFQANYSFR